MRQQRNEVIDLCRGIAAILMILGHSFIVYPVDISKIWWCSGMEHFIYTFHMELFFVVAGVVYNCSDYKAFIKTKFYRLVIPYLFFGILTMLFKAYGGNAINGVEPIGYGIKKLILYGGNYWFLYVLFIIFVFYPFIDAASERIKMLKYILIIGCIGVRFFIYGENLFQIGLVIKHLPYFIVGNMLSDRIHGGGKQQNQITDLCMLYSGVLCFRLCYRYY